MGLGRKYGEKKGMRNLKNNKIRLIDCVSDLALATIILGIAMIIFGGTMIVGSAMSMMKGYSLLGGSSHLLFFAVTHGIVFITDGILLSIFCFLVATTSPLANSFSMLSGFAFFCMILDTTALIMGAALGANAFGVVVSIAGLTISGIIAYLIRKMRVTAERMRQAQAFNVVSGLKKVG